MKKVILIVLSILTCFYMAIGLTACGKDGQSNTPTIEIGSDGYWYVNGTKTDCKANGEQGDKGEKGDKGDSGEQGEKGEKGDKGDAGEKGSDGINGSNGVDGKDGINGSDGKDGKDGVDGKTPEIKIGENGNWFIDGVDTNVKAQGEKGDKGDAGENGSDGKDGVNGSDGKDGKDGVDGKTPEIKIGENGNWFIDGVDTNVKAQGEKGDKGDAGENGSDGKDGVNGSDGKDGVDGKTPEIKIGENGNWFIDGVDTNVKAHGEKGDKGDAGENGSDGKDGNGVTTIVINDKGELIITLDDGTVINAGQVVAPVRKLDENNNIKFNTLTVGGNAVTGSVAYGSDIFDFNSEITINGYAGFKVYKDVTGKEEIETKVQSLNLGENVFYIKEYCGETSRFYTVTVTRSDPQVTFDSNGGTECESKFVKAGELVEEPATTRDGYVFAGWNYDFSLPIENDITITAEWNAIFAINGNKIIGVTDKGKELSEITVPETIDGKEINVIDEKAFNSISTLEKVTLSDKIRIVNRYAFYYCGKLSEIIISDNIEEWDRLAIEGCKVAYNSYEDGKYFGSQNNPYLIMLYATNTSITDLKIHNGTKIICNDACKELKSITEIVIPDSVQNIETSAFSNCSNVLKVTIGKNVKKIGAYAFSGCKSLASVIIPNSVTTIGDHAFYFCTGLTNVTIGDGVTSIGAYAFSDCDLLEKVTIESSVATIEYRAFFNCKGLKEIEYNGTKEQWNAINKGSEWKGGSTGSVVVYCSDGEIKMW